MQAALGWLSARVRAGTVSSLELQSFDMVRQFEVAFRTLQSGLNTGKVVVRLTGADRSLGGAHMVTGGTGGIGLVVGRWLAGRGASRLVLASRRGSLGRSTSAEWGSIQRSGAMVSLERCDTGDASDVSRVAGRSLSLAGAWHAAGLL